MNLLLGGSLLRGVLRIGGTLLATLGYVDADEIGLVTDPQTEMIAGCLIAAFGQGWSLFEKLRR
jgi:hypothetical protein